MPTADEDSTKLMKKIIKKLDFAWDADKIENPGTGCVCGREDDLVCFLFLFLRLFFFVSCESLYICVACRDPCVCEPMAPAEQLEQWLHSVVVVARECTYACCTSCGWISTTISPAHAMSHLDGLR